VVEILATNTGIGTAPQQNGFYTYVLSSSELRPQDNYGNGLAIPQPAVMLGGLAYRAGLVTGAEAESRRLAGLAAAGHSAFVVRQRMEDPALEDPVVAYWTFGRRWWQSSLRIVESVVDPNHGCVRTDPFVLGALAQLGLELPKQNA